MKKWKAICHIAITLLLMAVSVQASEQYSDGYFYYHSHEAYISVCGYFGSEENVEIPDLIAGRPVSVIEKGAFSQNNSVVKVRIPDTVMRIEEGAFLGAQKLEIIDNRSETPVPEEDARNVTLENNTAISPADGVSDDEKDLTEKAQNKSDGLGISGHTETVAGEKNDEMPSASKKSDAKNKTAASEKTAAKYNDSAEGKESGSIIYVLCLAVVTVACAGGIFLYHKKRGR